MLATDDNNRLMRCFASVFPGATPDEIKTTDFEEIPGWDSLRGVTLLAALDEEFGLQIDLPELLELKTFDRVKTWLMQQA